MNNMQTAIVTGADGLIGSHLIKRLIDAKVKVWAVVKPNSSAISRLDKLDVSIVECELNKLERLPNEADVFYHLAWNGVAPELRNDFDLQVKNIDYCLSCVRAAAKYGSKKFILPGSTFEYLYYHAPINENAVPSPVNAYGSVKLAARFLCAQLARELGLNFIYTVITGIYSADRKDNNVIFYTINELLNGRKPKLTSLEQKWDYVHIDDVSEALYLIGKSGRDGRFYAIGYGDNIPLKKYIYKIRDIIDSQLPLGIGEVSLSGEKLPSSCIDLTAIIEDTGFSPKIPFEIGIAEVIRRLQNEL